MKLLAIDPGTTESALVVWDGSQISSAIKIPNDEVLDNIALFCSLDGMFPEPSVFCEKIESYGMAVGAEVFTTCLWSGRYWEITKRHNTPFYFVPRREVKLHLCGQARAKDSNISQALKDRFGDKGTKKNPGLTYGLKKDLWQAFALAVTCYDQPELMEKYKV